MEQTAQALVLEDDRSWQQILSEILTDAGLAVDICSNLEEARKRLHEKAYRFAVVDLSLGERDHLNQDGIRALQDYGAYTCLRKENFRRSDFRDLVLEAASTAPSQSSASDRSRMRVAESPFPLDEQEPLKNVTSPKSALLVEDDAGWRNLLVELLEESNYQVRSSSSYGEAIGWLKRLDFDLAVADLSLASSLEPEKNLDGYRLLASTLAAAIPTIVVSGVADVELIDQAYSEHKIFAYLEKQAFNRATFLMTIRNAEESRLEDPILASLTERERQVLHLLAKGLTNKEIAADLFITTNTVKRHLKSIFEKLEVTTRAAGSAWASRMGLDAE
jgi:RNA polymerase sigma factor (sigma-70 family)